MLNCKQMLHKAAACLAGTAMTISMFPAAVHAQGTEDRVQSIMDGMTLDKKSPSASRLNSGSGNRKEKTRSRI